MNSDFGCVWALYILKFLFIHQWINLDKWKWSNELSSDLITIADIADLFT